MEGGRLPAGRRGAGTPPLGYVIFFCNGDGVVEHNAWLARSYRPLAVYAGRSIAYAPGSGSPAHRNDIRGTRSPPPALRGPVVLNQGVPGALFKKTSPEAQTTMSRPEKEQAPVPGMITCLVTPKLTFSVPRDARWRTAADVPQQALQRGFAHRFPLPPVNLDKLRFESVGSTKVLADTAVYRLTSSEEGDERILASLLKGLEAAVDTKHRAPLEKARTDLLASSATFQVMAGEVKERQDEGRWTPRPRGPEAQRESSNDVETAVSS